jgi:hypothetical protein
MSDTKPVPIYRHGFSTRIRVTSTVSKVSGALETLDWPDGRRWRQTGPGRFLRSGSVWLSGRAPRNPKLSLAALNRKWGTKLYALGFEFTDDDGVLDLDFSGVRSSDTRSVLEDVLDFEPHEHVVRHHRQMEVYAALSAPAAWRLAARFGGELRRGRGTMARKVYLLEDAPVLMVLPVRRRRTARLSIYKIAMGATALYKAELSVHGNRQHRTELVDTDVVLLEDKLRDLLSEVGVTALEKPSRWEPVDESETWPYPPDLTTLWGTTYRGSKPAPVEPGRLHTLGDLSFLYDAGSTVENAPVAPGTRVRPPNPDLRVVEGGRRHSRWVQVLTDEVLALPDGFLVEVVLDADLDPTPLVEALTSQPSAGVAYVGLVDQLKGPLSRLVQARGPVPPDGDLLVVVVEPTAPGWALTGVLEEWVGLVERDGARIVLITADDRNPWRPALHDHTSTVEGGRFFANQRYRVELDAGRDVSRIDIIKDERHGRHGRVLWPVGRGLRAAPPRRRVGNGDDDVDL